MAGIRYIGTLHGGEPWQSVLTVANDATLSSGEMLTMASSEADAGTTNDTAFIGIALEAVDNSADGEVVHAIIDPHAVYAYRDGTAHAAGATLDLAASGTALAATANADFTVITNNAADEDTLFIITPGEHWLHP